MNFPVSDAAEVWDCHTHIFGPWNVFPLAENPSYTPNEAPFSTLRVLHEKLGVNRGVIVQANCYGHDHSALFDAMESSGGAYRGIALIEPDVDEAILNDMHRRGIRGVRLGLMPHLNGAIDVGYMQAVLVRAASYGWHALLHGNLDDVLQVAPELQKTGTTIVIDHMGRVPAVEAADAVRLAPLLDIVSCPDVWIKLSGADRISTGRRPFNDSLPVMRALLNVAAQRAIWGTDWPHVNIRGELPDAFELLKLLHRACDGDAVLIGTILSNNPGRLYA